MIHKMMSKECCCKTCYKRLYCCGCMCNRGRSECVHKKMHESFGDNKVVGDLDDKRESK